MSEEINWEELSETQVSEDLDIISELTKQMLDLGDQIEAKEEELKELKKKYQLINQGSLPEALISRGLLELKHESGRKLIVEKFYQASIKDERVAFKWLEDTGNDAIIKTDITAKFGKGEKDRAKEAAEQLRAMGIACNMKTGVHHSTLRAFVKEQVEEGTDIPLQAFGVYIGNRIKVK